MQIMDYYKTVHITNLIGSFFSDFSQKKKKNSIYLLHNTQIKLYNNICK